MTEAPVVLIPQARAAEFDPYLHIAQDAGATVETVDLSDPMAKAAALARATVCVVSGNIPTREVDFATAPHLRAILTGSIGTNHIDQDAATRHGVMVGNVPDLCVDEVADHALMLLLACYRRMPYVTSAARAGDTWCQDGIRALDKPWPRIRGLTAGIVALGHIGQAMAPRCQSVGLRVIAHDPYLDPQIAADLDVELVSFDELLAQSDYLSIHAPESDETHHMMDAAALAKMKPTATLINTGRGGVVDEAALIDALQAGRIAGAALDVLEVEPPDPSNPLFAMDNVIVTPHIAGGSDGSRAWSKESTMRDAAAVVQGGRPRSLQNPAVLARLEGGEPA